MQVQIKQPSKHSDQKSEINVTVEDHDVWNLDWTLAQIIAPSLKHLKLKKNGGPLVDYADVPEHMRPTEEEIEQYNEEAITDKYYFERWDWVLDEMIWAFEIISNDDSWFVGISEDDSTRVDNALRLFAKYYRSLWW